MTQTHYQTMINHVVSNISKISSFNFVLTLKKAFLPIFLALLISTNIDQLLNNQVEIILRSPNGISSVVWLYAAISIVTSIIFPIITSLLACYYLMLTSKNANLISFELPKLKSFIMSRGELSTLECVRALGYTFLWCFLFIIPGIIKYCYYLLAPLVAAFSKKYHDGTIDALEASTYIFKKIWPKYTSYLFVFGLFIPMILSTIFDEYLLFGEHIIWALFFVGVNAVLVLVFHYLILEDFLNNLKEYENGINV